MSALADGTSWAVPTTVTPGDPSRSAASPSAIAGWSSTIATRIRARPSPMPSHPCSSKHRAAFHTLPQRAGFTSGSRRVGLQSTFYVPPTMYQVGPLPDGTTGARVLHACDDDSESHPPAPPSRRSALSVRVAARAAGPPVGQRQAHGHDGAPCRARGRLDLAAVRGDDLAGDVQAEAQARRPMRVGRAGCRRRTSSGCPRAATPGPWSRTVTSAVPVTARPVTSIGPGARRVLHRVGQEVQEDLLEPAGIGSHRHGPGAGRSRRIGGAFGSTCATSTTDRTTAPRSTTSSRSSSWPLWIRLTSRSRSMSVARRRVWARARVGVCARPRPSRRRPGGGRPAGGSCGSPPSAS